MTDQLLFLSGCAILALLVWIWELLHRNRVYESHIKRLEEDWYEQTFSGKVKRPPPAY